MPKVKVGNDNRDGVAGQNTYSAHVGGGSMSFDSAGDLYIGTGDDVDPFGQGGNGYAPLDQRYPERYDARNTSLNTNDLRGKVLRIARWPTRLGAAGVGTTYSIPPGNMFAPGTERTKPEIFAMGFRNPFSVRPTRPSRGRSSSATTGPTRRPTTPRAARPGSSSGTASPSPASTAGRCARATTRPPTPTSATRSRAARRAPASTARRRRSPTSRRTIPAWPASPARPWRPTSGTSAPATIPRASRSRPAPARRNRSPGRSTTTTPPTRPTPSGRRTTTARG